MEDLRDAEHNVAAFALLIQQLDLEVEVEGGTHSASSSTKRQNSGASSERPSPKSSVSARWRSHKKKDWDETTEGILWNELEKPQSHVARKYGVDQTLLKEYISTTEMMSYGAEFAQYYHHQQRRDTARPPTSSRASSSLLPSDARHPADSSARSVQTAYWAAGDLFFDLQAVKQGDVQNRWTRRAPCSSSYTTTNTTTTTTGNAGSTNFKKDWDLADHLIRFILLAEVCRPPTLDFDTFAVKVSFFLSILRCYVIRDAKQRQLALSPQA